MDNKRAEIPIFRTGFIDTHCHLDMFGDDSDLIIAKAREAGCEALVTISSDIDSNGKNLLLAEQHDIVFASAGIHPHDAKTFTQDVYASIESWSFKPKVVAIGETGLDYHYDHSPRATQREVFKRHIELSRKTGLPLIIHSREADDDMAQILSEQAVTRGVMHCFSGTMATAEKLMSMGLYISIAGPVTFKKSVQLQDIAKAIPDDYLMVETDAPYLSPEPLRGKRNEPAHIRHTISCIAGLRGVSPEDIARITSLNAKRLFNIGMLSESAEIAYRIRNSLYLNITNRCTNRCSFCVKFHSDYVKGHCLRLTREPSETEIIEAIGEPSQYDEVVFCGYGEPLVRLDTVKNVSRWIKEHHGKVRINTNGHAGLIHKRDILPELAGIVDSISVSLDAHDAETYDRICSPAFSNAFPEIINFIRRSRAFIPSVQITIVALESVDTEKCRSIAEDLGVGFRIRSLDVVG